MATDVIVLVILNDKIWNNVSESQRQAIFYHVNSCARIWKCMRCSSDSKMRLLQWCAAVLHAQGWK